jgi:hypothetical protein
MRSISRLTGAAAAALAVALSVPAAAAPALACEAVVVSPTFARDRTAACLYRKDSVSPMLLATSADGGRSWRAAAMTGLARPEGVQGTGLTVRFSPAYATDRTLLAVTGSGLFLSTDRGETFSLVDGLVGGGGFGNPLVYLAAAPATTAPVTGTGRHLYVLFAAGHRSALVDATTRWHQPVTGAPGGSTVRFALGATSPVAFGYTQDPFTGVRVLAAYRCGGDYSCADPLFTFPPGVAFAMTTDEQAQTLRDGSLVVTLADAAKDVHVWRSTDGGATFAVWRPVDAVLAPVNRTSESGPRVSLMPDPARAGRLFLRVTGGAAHGTWAKDAPPAEQVLRSDDSGRTWLRLGYQRAVFQPGHRGTLPWNETTGDPAGIVPAGDGRTVLVAATYVSPGESGTRTGAYCSRDAGLHWGLSC